MKRIISILVILLLSFLAVSGQPCLGAATITDVDGNTYYTVQIGNQCWMKENLRTTHYADGASIALGSSTSTITAYRYCPNNDASNVATYGYLYNWPAVMHNSSSSSANPSGVQGICPNGWHVPSDAEWTQLANYVKSLSQYVSQGCTDTDDEWTFYCIAKAMASSLGWVSSADDYTPGNNPSSNNVTGFSALPAGYYSGNYYDFGKTAVFWSATADDSTHIYNRELEYDFSGLDTDYSLKHCGFSVRCVKD